MLPGHPPTDGADSINLYFAYLPEMGQNYIEKISMKLQYFKFLSITVTDSKS